MEEYKLIIPIVAKDISLIISNIEKIKNYLNSYKLVFIGNAELKSLLPSYDYVEFIDENTIFSNLNIGTIKQILVQKTGVGNRAGWYFQQFLKMAYSQHCEDEYYLVWDSDTLPLEEIGFFNADKKPYLSYRPFEKHDLPYFDTIKNIFNIETVVNSESKSYVVEHMLFNTKIMRQLISNIESNLSLAGNTFFEKIINAVPHKNLNLSGFSEFETYVAFVMKDYPDFYVSRFWNNLRCGKIFLGEQPDEESLQWISKAFVSVSIERYDKEWKIFKIKAIRKMDFLNVYNFFYPIIRTKFNIRMFLRKYLKHIYLKLLNLKQ